VFEGRNAVPWNMARMLPERSIPRNGCPGMDTPSKYREFAEECDRLAKQAKTNAHRRILEEMARVWRQLADEGDGK
jgi:hypothetical protein